MGSEVDPGAPESISKVMGAVNDKHDWRGTTVLSMDVKYKRSGEPSLS